MATTSPGPETPQVVYLVHQPGEGTFGIVDTLAAAQALAADRVQDYFGEPIQWVERLDGRYWEGRYHEHAHRTGIVLIEEHQVRTLASLGPDPTTGQPR